MTGPFRAGAHYALGGDPWAIVHDAVFAGLNHALSNRVMGMEGVIAIGQRRGAVDWPSILAEQERSTQLLQLYRLLEVVPDERAEPMHVSEPVADATSLLRHHLALRDVIVGSEIAPESAVVTLPRRSAVRAILVLLYEAARRAERGGGGVLWRYEVGAGDVTVMATTRPGVDADADAVLVQRAAQFVGRPAPDAWCVLDPGRSYIAALRLPLVAARHRS